MKRDYYHFNLTCPNCHEPHISGMPILIENDVAKCSSCNIKFKLYINFNRLQNITSYLSSAKTKLKIPLMWKIDPNCIEKSYLEWMIDIDPDKYLITWPWKQVKFIPLMVSEYILKNPEKKVVIIADLNDHHRNVNNYHCLDKLFNNIIYSKEISHLKFEREIKREINKFDKKNVLIKDLKTFYKVNQIGSEKFPRQQIKGYFDGGAIKCKNRLFDQFEEEYGKESIRYLKKVLTRTNTELINEDGFLDVTIERRKEWGGDLNYNKIWLFNILFEPQNFEKLNKKLKIHTVFSEDDRELFQNDSNLVLISDEINPEFIFKKISDLNFDLVIINSFDNFIKDRYWGNKNKAMLKFLDKTKSTVIMFSCTPDIRYLFKLSLEDDIIEKYNIKLHTWDSNLIIEKLKQKIERKYQNPLSSSWDELPPSGNKPDIEYSYIPELVSVDEILLKVNALGQKYTLFFEDLKKSPLFLEGDTENNYEIFKRKFGPTSWINYYNLMMSLRRRDEDLFLEIYHILINIYGIDTTQKNPLLDKISETLKELINDEETFISIVVHGMDVPGTKQILRRNGFEEYIPDRINVLKWDKLPLREQELSDDTKHIVISTRPPSLNYKLYFTQKVDKFIFVGSEGTIKTFTKIIENRLTEQISRPINFDSINENSPKLLIDVLKDLYSENNWKESDEIIENTYLEEYKIKIPSFEFSSPLNEKLPHLRHKIIKEGENAVLVIDNVGKGMFLPLNKDVFFKVNNNDIFHEIEIKKSELSEIENKEILIDRGGVYTSFKHVFTKFMAENGQKILIKGGMFKWENFLDLIGDSTEWIKILKNVLKRLANEKKISLIKAEDILSTFLATLDLNAKDKDHIKKWWLDPELIETELGFVPVYDIEHPKGLNDLIKIYNGLKILFPDLKITKEDAERTYIAAITLQKVRRNFFKNKKDDLGSQQKLIYELLRKEINKIINQSETFKIVTATNVLIINDVHALETLSQSEYAKYISKN